MRGVADEQHGTARPGVKDDLLNRAGLPGAVAVAGFVERVEQGGHWLGVPARSSRSGSGGDVIGPSQ